MISPTRLPLLSFFTSSFFFNNTPTTEIYTLSLHDALPILTIVTADDQSKLLAQLLSDLKKKARDDLQGDRKSTRLNSSHMSISYAVFCLKKKKKTSTTYTQWIMY